MNISDAERVSAVLEGPNYKLTPNIDEANLIVVVMCSVRQSAVNRVHGLVEKFKKLKKTNPKLRTILTGCLLKKDKNKFLENFNFVIDIKDIKKLPELISIQKVKDTKNYLTITPIHAKRLPGQAELSQ